MKKVIVLACLCLFVQTGFAQYCTPSFYYGTFCANGMVLATPSRPFVIAGETTLIDTNRCSGAGSTGHYGYLDFSATTMTCVLSQGRTYSVTACAGTSYTMAKQIWIDFNSDSTFQTSESVGGHAYLSIFTITIPSGVSSGTKRMRAICEYNYHTYPSINPCSDGSASSSYYYGEIRDYTVTIGSGSLSPSSLNFGSVATSSTSFGSAVTGLNAAYLTPSSGNVTVSASTNFVVCSSSTGTFVNSYTISYTGATISANSVYVKFVAPATAGAYSGTVDVTGGGLSSGFVRASVSGIAAPHCTGTPSAGSAVSSLTAAATGDTFTLRDIGYSSGVGGLTFQWQSSPTGTSGWTNITGATDSTYTYSGLTATTYYRCNVSCVYSSSTATSGSTSVIYLPPCTGAPSGGTATATSTSCSSCSTDTVYVTGRTMADSLIFQWQRSPNGTSGWTNIAGATTDRYAFAPDGDYYYRLAVTCLITGLTGYSSPGRVSYAYHFVSHSVTDTATSGCSGPVFSVTANGNSPLLYLKSYYGDGTTDSVQMIGSPRGQTSVAHYYLSSGTYTIKQVIYFNNVAQDSVHYSYSYSFCHALPISFYFDSNGNGTYDTGSEIDNTSTMRVIVDSNGVTVDTINAITGLFYNALGAPGTVYTFRATSLTSMYFISSPSSAVIADTILAYVNTYLVKFFGLSCGSSGYDLSVYKSVRAGRHTFISDIYVQNNSCNYQNPVVTLNKGTKYDFLSATPTPTSTTSTTIIWNLGATAVSSGTRHLAFHGERPYSSGYLTPGDTVHSGVTVNPSSADVDTTNNTSENVDTVRSSFDPNFIQSSPAGHILAGTTLRYTVGFENDGNDTAHNIHVLDTLSDLLEERTLKPIFASHEMYVEKRHVGGMTIMKFDFPNIKLLDSSHHGLCQGIFVYDINVKDGLPDCTIVPARVGIYFDDNEVVMTNEERNIIGCWPSGVAETRTESDFVIYPNPAKDQLTVQMSTAQNVDVIVTNSLGAVVLRQTVSHAVNKLDIRSLASGIYYVKLTSEQGSVVKKLVKM